MSLFSSLQGALALYFTAAALLPLLLFGTLADRYLGEQHLGQIKNELVGHTTGIQLEVDEILGELQDNLLLARDLCRSRLSQGRGDLDLVLGKIVENSSSIISIYLIDEQDKVKHLGLTGRLLVNRDDFLGLDLSGQTVIRTLRERGLANLPEGVWSEVAVSVATGEPTISLALPTDGAILLGTVSLQRLGNILQERLSLRDGLGFAIVDRHGVLVAHSDMQQVLQRTNVLDLHPEIADALASGQGLPFKYHEDESFLESLRVISGPKWVVHATMLRKVAMAPLRNMEFLLLISVAASLLLGLGLAFWLSRRISRPLMRLRATSLGLAAGDYDEAGKLKGTRFREVDDLTMAFRAMADIVRVREATLRDNESRYRSLVEGMGEGLIIVSHEGVVVDANRSAERILGLDRDKLVGAGPTFPQWTTIRPDGSLFAADEHPTGITLRDGIELNNVLMGLQHPDGREIWLQLNSRPIFDVSGRVEKALVTFANVSGLKAAEESLRLSKMRFQELYQQFTALLEGITDRIVLLSPDWRIVWSNHDPPARENATEAGSRQCCYELYFGGNEPCPGCPAAQAFASSEPATGEITTGRGRTWQLKAYPVFGHAGAVQNVVLIAEDITETRESERQRTRDARLAALGELAAGVAHEINNPISGVINYAQLILNRAGEGSREHDLAQRIIKEGDRVAIIVRELLTFAREESSDLKVVSVREALAEALALCESQLRKEGVDLRIDLPPDLPMVESRNHQIQQLFLNLISNARHALAEKYPGASEDKLLQISGRKIAVAGQPFIRLQIRDNGTGIAPELLERVMNPFVTTKPAGVGTGLGLSISFEIVKKHGGAIEIASDYGQWTEVTIDLPALKVS